MKFCFKLRTQLIPTLLVHGRVRQIRIHDDNIDR